MIDKILYYFGYAPITIRHEVVYHAVGKPIDTVVCRSVLETDDYEEGRISDRKVVEESRKSKLTSMLFEEISKAGLIDYLKVDNNPFPNSKVYAQLRIVKN
jgi:hypothetical protein